MTDPLTGRRAPGPNIHVGQALAIPGPYSPEMSPLGAVYRIEVGPEFYIGSTTRLGARRSDHRLKLERGIHPNTRLQEAWNVFGEFELFLIEEIPPTLLGSEDHVRRLKAREQIELDALFGTRGCCNRSSSAIHNSNIGEFMKAKWLDTGFQESQRAKMAEIARRPVSEETRRRMTTARLGKGKACVFLHKGEILRFTSVTAAAEHFKVAHQAVDQWLRGKTEQPGSPRAKRCRNPKLAGLLGCYDQCVPGERWMRLQLENAVADAGLTL